MLTKSHKEADMLICYSTPQSFSAYTSRAILLLNKDKINSAVWSINIQGQHWKFRIPVKF